MLSDPDLGPICGKHAALYYEPDDLEESDETCPQCYFCGAYDPCEHCGTTEEPLTRHYDEDLCCKCILRSSDELQGLQRSSCRR